jgi:hypothetical protein
VRERIENDAILRREQTGNHTQIRVVAGTKGQGGIGALERRQILFNLEVQNVGAGEQARAAAGASEAAHGRNRGGLDPRVPHQTQIVVGRQHQHLTPFGLNPRAGAAFERDLVRVAILLAGQAHHAEQATSPDIENGILVVAPSPSGCKESVKKFARGGL